MEKKRIIRNERRKNLKEHDANMVIHSVRKMEAAKNAGQKGEGTRTRKGT